MDLINVIDETNNLIGNNNVVTGEAAFNGILTAAHNFAWALPETLVAHFGELTDEQAQERQEEINAYMLTEDFKEAFKARQLKSLAETAHTTLTALVSFAGSVGKAEDTLHTLLAFMEVEGKSNVPDGIIIDTLKNITKKD